mmetsp:Transcript_14306/g.17671  ORF Transcript_14306/g.17671 Transcript_14306/m.17671 type:complete len:87 (+) Transcript_14306:426-686(+)
MTYSISQYDPNQPLSILTVKSLQDLGYKVNVAQAEAYTLPSHTRRLRGNIQTTGQNESVHNLDHDIPEWFNPYDLTPIPAQSGPPK